MSKYTNDQHIFALALAVYKKYLKKLIFDLKKVGQGHGLQFSQCHHSIAGNKLFKSFPYIFALALSVWDIQREFKVVTVKK